MKGENRRNNNNGTHLGITFKKWIVSIPKQTVPNGRKNIPQECLCNGCIWSRICDKGFHQQTENQQHKQSYHRPCIYPEFLWKPPLLRRILKLLDPKSKSKRRPNCCYCFNIYYYCDWNERRFGDLTHSKRSCGCGIRKANCFSYF